LAEVSAAGITMTFGGIVALSDVSLALQAGQICGLVGPNGAGKTTLFNVMTGLYRPDKGTVSIDGHDVTRLRSHRRARLGMARTFQRLELFGTLTARENVRVALEARKGGRGSGDRADSLLREVGIADRADVPADFLPTGQARLVELARAMACDPRFILLDEPGSGLDKSETLHLADVLRNLAAQGIGVLLVEHDVDLVMRVSSEVTVLDFGRVIARGDPAAVRSDPAVRAAYLGDDQQEGGTAVRAVTLRSPESATPKAGTTPPPAVEVRHVRAGYGRIEVLHDVSLSVPRGSVYALIGPNGAGKSTLLKVLSSRLPASSGEVVVGGVRMRPGSSWRIARAGVCTIPERRGTFPNLTVRENVQMFTHKSRRLKTAEVEERTYEVFPVLGERSNQLAGRLSGGQVQMLAFARALATDPDVLLLDEISMGLAPMIVSELYERLGELAADGRVSMLIVEQFAMAALAIADRAGVMTNGRIVLEGTPAEVSRQLDEAYLGDVVPEPRKGST
jgi:branched-chain amino acid transport system ATP-binding protein